MAFRNELRAYFRDNLPGDIRKRMRLGHAPTKDNTVTWQRILNRRSWAAYSWPKEYGGPGWTPVQRMIFLEENQLAPAPEVSSFHITMLGPVLIHFGTGEQKQRFLPRAANIDDWWCQGFSEPGAGSDLASLNTAAKRDGDFWSPKPSERADALTGARLNNCQLVPHRRCRPAGCETGGSLG